MSSDLRNLIRTQLLDWAFKPGEGVDQRGRALSWSLDCRELTLRGPTLSAIAQQLWPLVAVHRPGLIVGPSLSADPIVAAMLLTARSCGVELNGGLLRRKRKEYGLRKLVEGPPVIPGVIAVVVDDVLTSGLSTARAVRILRELGAVPCAVVTIVDLGRNDSQRLDGIRYETLFKASELGLSFSEPSPSTYQGWTIRGVNSPIPAARPVLPVFTRDKTILAGSKSGVLAVDRKGRAQSITASKSFCVTASADLLVLGNASAVTALDPISLHARWNIDLGTRAACCSADGGVYIALDAFPKVLRIDAVRGVITAASVLPSRVENLHVLDDALIAITSSEVLALENTFDKRWVLPEPTCSAVVANDGMLFIMTRGPEIVRLDSRNASVIWSRPVGHRTLSQLVADRDGVVFAVESVIVALSGTGAVRWVHTAPRRIVAGPVACGAGALAVADHGGIVRMLDLTNGKHIASYCAQSFRPISLAGSPTTIVGISANGDAWGVDLDA